MATRIILADDHKIIRDGLRSVIEKVPGIDLVAEADNGLSAVELTAKHKPDVVVMDINMPGMNGIEATGSILSRFPDIRVIGLSMYADRRIVEEMFRAGAMGYVLKDCAFDELAGAVGAVVSGRMYLSPFVRELFLEKHIRRISEDDTLLSRILPLMSKKPAAEEEYTEFIQDTGAFIQNMGDLGIFWIFKFGLRPWSDIFVPWEKTFKYVFEKQNDSFSFVSTFSWPPSPDTLQQMNMTVNKSLNSYRKIFSTCMENINGAAGQGYNVGLKSVDLAGRNFDIMMDWMELNLKTSQALGESTVELCKSAASVISDYKEEPEKPVVQTWAESLKNTTLSFIENSQFFISIPKFIESCGVCMKLTATHYKRLAALPYQPEEPVEESSHLEN